MSSVVDIANMALSNIGDSATVSNLTPPEGSAQATHCARFYPMARDSLLELHDWAFATRRATLALLSDAPAFGYAYAYQAPNDMLKARFVVDPALPGAPVDFVVEDDGTNKTILTDQANAAMLYTMRVTDTGKFPPLVEMAMSWLLSAYLAGPIIKGDAGKQVAKDCMGTFAYWLGKATESDSSQRRTTSAVNSPANFKPSAIAAR